MYRPRQHKGRHRGKVKNVPIGPKAQAILAEYTPADPLDYYFSPRRAAELHQAERAANRKTPKYPSHLRRNFAKRTAVPKRKPGRMYLVTSYEHAITRAIKRANREREKVAAAAGLESFEAIPHWAPNQLRHTRGTQVRVEYGLEAAQVARIRVRTSGTRLASSRWWLSSRVRHPIAPRFAISSSTMFPSRNATSGAAASRSAAVPKTWWHASRIARSLGFTRVPST